jgi:hypothetical protein
VFCISVSFFYLRFSISLVTSLILSIFFFNSFISLFIEFSVSLWCLWLLWVHLFVYVSSCIFYFWCLGISWVHFGWPCLVTSSWNSQWLLTGFILWEYSCRYCWGLWCHLSLFCWSLELDIHFLHFPLNPILNYFRGENDFHPFFVYPSLCLLLCNYVLDKLLVVSVTCFLSLGWILFCGCNGFLV